MRSLIIKDLFAQQKYLIFLAVIFVVFTLIEELPGEIILNVALITTAMRLAYLEDKNKTLVMLKTMPMKSTSIVMSKYISTFIFGLIFFSLSVVVYFIGLGSKEGLLITFVSIPILLVLTGIYYFLFFKLGYIKATSVIRVLFIVMFIPLTLPPVIKTIENGARFLNKYIPFTYTTGIIVYLFIIGLYFFLGLLSSRAFENREQID